MRPDRFTPAGFPVARVAAFAALAALAAAQWMRLVEDPPAGRVALAAAAVVCGAALVALIGTRLRSRRAAAALAAVVVLGAIVIALVAIGIPGRLVEPSGWDGLARRIGDGLSGLRGDISYPYGGGNWTRIVILAGLPLALAAAAALAFWPRGGSDGSPIVRRGVPLAILIATFGLGATIVAPAQPLIWGFLLLLGIMAWRWLPSLSGRDAISATVVVAAAGALALPIAAALDASEPRIDFRDWELGRSQPATFDWNHSYGPLDWPRNGTALAAIRAQRAEYWKQAVLEDFDGRRWVQSDRTAGDQSELPTQVEQGIAGATLVQRKPEWIQTMDVTIGPLESEFVLGAGALVSVAGIQGVSVHPDGNTTVQPPLDEGDSYNAVAYVPHPKPRQLRDTPSAYPSSLSRFTEVSLPGRPARPVEVPLRGSGGKQDERATTRAFAASPYDSTFRLARELTESAPTGYAATRVVERHFQQGFTYEEDPPSRADPIPAFLFRDRVGYCQQFSGAMALMLRMAGIPARVASGFSPGTPDPEIKHRYLVEDLDAHSWVEAYFPTIGWVTFDPTPSSAPATGRTPAGQLAGEITSADPGADVGPTRKGFIPEAGPENRLSSAIDGGGSSIALWIPFAIAAALILIAAALLAAATALRRLRYRRLSPAARADAHLAELPTALARLGWPLASAETLLRIEQRLHRYRKQSAAAYVAKLRSGRFSPTPAGIPTLVDRRALRAELAGRDLRDRIRGWFALPPGGPRRG